MAKTIVKVISLNGKSPKLALSLEIPGEICAVAPSKHAPGEHWQRRQEVPSISSIDALVRIEVAKQMKGRLKGPIALVIRAFHDYPIGYDLRRANADKADRYLDIRPSTQKIINEVIEALSLSCLIWKNVEQISSITCEKFWNFSR